MLKLTAKNARKIAKTAILEEQQKNLIYLLARIKEEATTGNFELNTSFIYQKNIKELEKLGYKVEDQYGSLPKRISW